MSPFRKLFTKKHKCCPRVNSFGPSDKLKLLLVLHSEQKRDKIVLQASEKIVLKGSEQIVALEKLYHK